MSHNILLDLTDVHYPQHISVPHSSKFIPTKHQTRSSGSNKFNAPSNFHDLFIIIKRMFLSQRFMKVFLTLLLTCIVAFTILFTYSILSYHGSGHHLSKANLLSTKESTLGDEIISFKPISDSAYKPLTSIGMSKPIVKQEKKYQFFVDNNKETIRNIESNIQSSHELDQSHQTPTYAHNDRIHLVVSYGTAINIYSDQAVAMSPPSMSSSLLPRTHSHLTATDFEQNQLNKNQIDIRDAMRHSWNSYKRYAWGYDMLKPRAKRPDQWFNLGLTIVDSVDTLIMMNLLDDSEEALDWIESKLDFDNSNNNSNCFELTIRILGGLLSAYHLRPERTKVLAKATDLGHRLLHCYDTVSGIVPNSDIDLAINQSHAPPWYPYSSLSEVSSIQLEFRDLTRLTGQTKFETITFMTSLHLHNLTMQDKSPLLTMYIDPNNGKMDNSRITLGARADSYYEYLLKQYLQTDIKWLETDYLEAINEIRDKLIKNTNGPMNLTFVAEIQKYHTVLGTEDLDYQNKMDHLVCFLPGTLILGYYHFSPKAAHLRSRHGLYTPKDKLNSHYDYHLDLAESVARTCYTMYNSTATGLSPEIALFGSADDKSELLIQSTSAHNILRPEFVESLFYLYHITGKQMYREQARQIFDSFNKHCRVPGGFSPIADVRKIDPILNLDKAPDRMESFWMSETLKYLYLIFFDDGAIISRLLNDYIFNTEGHIIPRSYSRLGLRTPMNLSS